MIVHGFPMQKIAERGMFMHETCPGRAKSDYVSGGAWCFQETEAMRRTIVLRHRRRVDADECRDAT